MNNIEVFRETMELINRDSGLRTLTKNAIDSTYVIDEGFVSKKTPQFQTSEISFEENLTLITAFRFRDMGKKTAILNFANPVEPGGGVWRGANTQEEYICRASNLYPCLESDRGAAYYQYHNDILRMNQFNSMFLSSDRIIYSSDITFVREDAGYYPNTECIPTQKFTDTWRFLDVLTCAAPFFSGSGYILPNGDLYFLLKKRIRNILEAAIDHEVEALVLGAFGCGAFHNPPTVVAKAFQDVLMEKRYIHAFSDVAFAVKRNGVFCENIEAFEIAFQRFPPTGEYVFSAERNKRRFFE